MIIAIVMAGGKGERMGLNIEKPLFQLNSSPLINLVLNNLEGSKYIDKIIVATSVNTPETKRYVNNNGYDYIETPGNGYLEDLSFILSKLEKKSKEDVLLIINADLPFISQKIIDNVLEEYFKNDSPAMSVLVPIEVFKTYCIEPSYVFDNLVPSGLNILVSQNKVQTEDKLIIPNIRLALNINTLADVKLANKIFYKV